MTAKVTEDFWGDAAYESGYQRQHWGAEHDAGKSDSEWFWLFSFIVGKVLRPGATIEKKRHRLRAAAGVLFWWDQQLAGRSVVEPEEQRDIQVHHTNDGWVNLNMTHESVETLREAAVLNGGRVVRRTVGPWEVAPD